ncbi:hypothetical protein ACRS64_17735 [Pseudomonas aeruginosa]|uniref:hypothetical protein n=1 Tax=Pseudomonas aeruginosa TaxID=287 RepID=UPI003DA77605
MNKANECTCPSGDGSLVHPCPAHPAVEQVGGDELEKFLAWANKEYEVEEGYELNESNTSVLENKKGWMARAALAQPSPAPELERPEVAEVAFVLRNIGAMDAEDIDGDNVDLRFEDAEGRDTGCDVSIVEYAEKAADLFEQHDRIVGALRAEITQLRQHKNDYMDAGQETYRALQNEIREREAEIARLDGLVSGRTAERDAALVEVERLRESKGDPVGSLEKCMKVMYERDEHAKRLEVALARVAELERQEPVDVPGPGPDEIHQMAFEEGQPAEDGDGYLFSAEEFDLFVQRLLDSCATPVAWAQHSVPEGWMLVECGIWTQEQVDEMQKTVTRFRNSEFVDDRALAMAVADAGQCKAPEISLAELLAAAPVCRLSRSALTDAQMRRLYDSSTETENERLGFAAFARLIRRAEAVHQITAAPGKEGV